MICSRLENEINDVKPNLIGILFYSKTKNTLLNTFVRTYRFISKISTS